ncbi:centrosomal protein of 57 kDa-like [Saccoglossus kowalevskii]|uniref:Centrosomal protein of 57 kDa-like n=1 Tax=Saccoglossus kowalevskii TaxID=10224 RepID=A0ABM0H000_SACKO|nr:PREDICTED: centrosomal protein of 57 kDa-like [Saccoglossus kowalevskii]
MDTRYSPARSPYLSSTQSPYRPSYSHLYEGYSRSPAVRDNEDSYRDYPNSRPLLDDQVYPPSPSTPTRSLLKTTMARSPSKAGIPESNTRAVISALRGLQDKIRKLESERSMAEENLKTLATETTEYKEILQKGNTVTKTSQTEMSKHSQEVESQLTAAESRCNLLEKQLEYMRKMVQNAESDRNNALRRSEILEQHQSERKTDDMRMQYDKVEQLERDHARLIATQTVADSKIRELEEKIKEETHRRKLMQDKAAELQTVAEANRILQATENSPREPKTKKPKKKKKKKVPCKKLEHEHLSHSEPRKHYRLNLAEIPFVAGKSTTPSHSIGANFQNVLAMMKLHNPAWCDGHAQHYARTPRSAKSAPPRRRRTSISSTSTSDSDLSDLLHALQDEFGQMGFEHQELAKQIQEANDPRIQEDLERELDDLVSRMEAKGEQISRLKRHRETLSEKKKKRQRSRSRPCSGRQRAASVTSPLSSNGESTSGEVQVITTVKTRGRIAQPVTIQQGDGKQSLRMLKDMQTLKTSLRKDDVKWD